MALIIADYPDPHGRSGDTLPAVYAWLPEIHISYHDATARAVLWVHADADDAATWPDGERVPPVEKRSIQCNAPVPGLPDVTFPSLAEVVADAASIAAGLMAGATTDEERAAVLLDVATGGAIRAALYAALKELVFPDATEAE